MMESDSGFLPPEFFFEFTCECHKIEHFEDDAPIFTKAHELPKLFKMWHESGFCKVFMGWHETGLYFHFDVDAKDIVLSYPDFSNADAIEIFIDTHNAKQSRSVHRFCHHFFFLPEPCEGVLCGEITRIRSEEIRSLITQDQIVYKAKRLKTGYSADIVLPSDVLFGFEPDTFAAIGFTYKVSRSDGFEQNFALSAKHCAIEQHPYLWASLHLK